MAEQTAALEAQMAVFIVSGRESQEVRSEAADPNGSRR